MNPPVPARTWADRGRSLSASLVRGFHAYANWLVGISWKRFFVLALLLLIATGVLQSIPPFSWRITETVLEPVPRNKPAAKTNKESRDRSGVEITIDEQGLRISSRKPSASASAPASGASPSAGPASAASSADPSIHIRLPADISEDTREAVREALDAAREAILDAATAHQDAVQAKADIEQALSEAGADLPRRMVERTRTVRWGDFLPELAFLWIVASIILKATYKGRVQAEAKAAVATEAAEAESLKRQVVEARMAAMQAQVEPHFLFNTLASIDHLIETDAARASVMQKNLIALLRASMPSLRETQSSGLRDLGRELEMVRPYLEILKVRMEERLQPSIEVPEGLLSAEFPPMMLQSLVENAIKHGLEPKAEGGSLRIQAEIVHGKLVVSVADSGLGFGQATTAGTGVGLANIRERLALLYGSRASFSIGHNAGGGTLAAITVPYRSIEGAST